MQSTSSAPVEIPDILREVPPEKFRQVVDALMGQEYRTTHLSEEAQIDEELRRPTGNRKVELLFTTGWVPDDQLRRGGAPVPLHVLYVGSANNSKIRQDGRSVPARQLWEDVLAGSGSLPVLTRTATLRAATVAGVMVLRRVVVEVGQAVIDYFREGE